MLRVNLVLAALLAAGNATGLANVHYGAPPPAFYVPTPHGAVPLASFRGKPVVINFWATWCPPCTAELPYFQRLEQTYGSRVEVVIISNEPAGVARSYLIAHHDDLPLLEDTGDMVFAAYSIGPVPDTLVLDPAGNVSYVSVGALDWKELNQAVESALREEASPAAGAPEGQDDRAIP